MLKVCIMSEFNHYEFCSLKNIYTKITLYQFTPNRVVQISKNMFAAEAYKKKKQDVFVEFEL